MIPDKERIEMMAARTGLSVNGFAKEIGYDRAEAVYVIMRDPKKKITRKMANKICKRFPQFNPIWVLTGTGDMKLTKEETKLSQINDNQTNKTMLLDRIIELSKQVGRLEKENRELKSLIDGTQQSAG